MISRRTWLIIIQGISALLFVITTALITFLTVLETREMVTELAEAVAPLIPPPEAPIVLASEQDLTLIAVVISNVVALVTVITTTIYKVWDEKRTRVMHELELVKMRLEIEKLRKEVEEAPQKGKKR